MKGLFFFFFLSSSLKAIVSGSLSEFLSNLQLVDSSQVVNLGTLYRGQRIQKSFAFLNRGQVPLLIRSIHTSCACSTSKVFPGNLFQPGERGIIEFSLNTSHLKGAIEQKIILDTNSPTPDQSLTLTLRGQVVDEVETNLDYFEFDQKKRAWVVGEGLLLLKKYLPCTQTDHRVSMADFRGFESLSLSEQKSLKNSSEILVKTVSGLFSVEKRSKGAFFLKPKFSRAVNQKFEIIQIWNHSCYSPLREIPIRLTYTSSLRSQPDYLDFGLLDHRQSFKTLTLDLLGDELDQLEVFLTFPESYSKEESDALKRAFHWSIRQTSPHKLRLFVSLKRESLKESLNVRGKLTLVQGENPLNRLDLPLYGLLKI